MSDDEALTKKRTRTGRMKGVVVVYGVLPDEPRRTKITKITKIPPKHTKRKKRMPYTLAEAAERREAAKLRHAAKLRKRKTVLPTSDKTSRRRPSSGSLFTGELSAGMPGNEETDPPGRRRY